MKYEADHSVDNLRDYQGVLHTMAPVKWPLKVLSVDLPKPKDSSAVVVVHGTCGSSKIRLTRLKTGKEISTEVFDALTKAKAGDTIYFTGVPDMGTNLSWDHPDPPPDELTYAVISVGN